VPWPEPVPASGASRDVTGKVQLYPVDGGNPKPVTAVSDSDRVIGGSPSAEILYVTPDISAVPMQIVKLSIVTGLRQPFVSVSPADPAGIVALGRPIFTADEKRYVYDQLREYSVLYEATGLK
jgi:hypothetical protein